jgi:hypothetical protein
VHCNADPEHTWGSAGYVNGAIDVTKWDNAAFHQAMRAPSSPLEKQQLTQTSQSYAEQRRFNMFALEAAKLDESTQFLASQSEQNLAELHVSIPSVAGLTVVNPAEWEQQLTCGAVVWSFDQTGAISSLRVGGKQYASKTHVLAQLQYQTYNESDFVWYHSSTANGCGATTCPCRSCEHGFGKFNSSCPIAGAIVRLSLSRSFPHTKLMCHRGFPVRLPCQQEQPHRHSQRERLMCKPAQQSQLADDPEAACER